MPLIQGQCIPPVCFRLRFNLANAAVVVFHRQTRVVDPQRSAAAAQLFAQALANWIQGLQPVDFKCDGCVCHMPRAAPVPVPIPDMFLARAGNWETVIRGGTYTFELGFCHPRSHKLGDADEEATDLSLAAGTLPGTPKAPKAPKGKSKPAKTAAAPKPKGRSPRRGRS
jgi:hypothetical protein